MTGEEIEALDGSLAVAGPNRQAGCRGQRCCSAIGRSHRSLPWDEDLACIIRRCSAASSERWPMARLRHLMTDRDRAKSRRSGGQGLAGISACDKAKEHGYPHELWTTRLLAPPCARARTGGGSPQCLARLAQGTVCKLLGQEEIKPHKGALLSGTPRRRVRSQDGGSSVCLPRGPGPEKAAAKAEKSKKPVMIVSYDEKPGIQAIATTAPDFAASARPPCELRAGS